MDFQTILGKINQGVSIADSLLNSGRGFSPSVVISGIFDRRISTISSFQKSNDYFLYPSFEDMPSLASREIVAFPSRKNYLAGYLYRVLSPKGMVIVVHGYNALADNSMSLFPEYFIQHGYNVFSIDFTACGRSEGLSIPGLEESAFDVLAAEEFLKQRNEFSSLPLFLLGHSWGAYGVLASLNFNQAPKAVFAFAGFTTPVDMMLGSAQNKVGSLIDNGKEDFINALKKRDPDCWNLSAIEGIEKAKNTDIYLFQGKEDKIVLPHFAVSNFSYSNPRVHSFFFENRGHNNLFYNEESILYAHSVKERANQIFQPYKGKIISAPKEIKDSFLQSSDKRKCCILDENLMKGILYFMDSSIRRNR